MSCPKVKSYWRQLSTAPRTTKQKPGRKKRNETLMTPPVHQKVTELAFDYIDPHRTGVVDGKLLDEIRNFIGYLIRNNKTEEQRQRQFYIASLGFQEYQKREREEAEVLAESFNLGDRSSEDERPEDKEDDEDEYDSDDRAFIASEDDEETLAIEYIEPHKTQSFQHFDDPVMSGEEDEEPEQPSPKRRRKSRVPRIQRCVVTDNEEEQEEEEVHAGSNQKHRKTRQMRRKPKKISDELPDEEQEENAHEQVAATRKPHRKLQPDDEEELSLTMNDEQPPGNEQETQLNSNLTGHETQLD